jgi:hypothetical protein
MKIHWTRPPACSRPRLAAPATITMPAVTALLGLALIGAPLARAGLPEPELIWYGKVLVASGDIAVRATSGTLSWQIEPLAGGTPWTLTIPLTNVADQFSFLLRVPCESPEPAVTATPSTVLLTSPATSYRRLSVRLDGQPLTILSAPTVFAPSLADRGRTERLDLVLGTLPPDSDGDGLGDSWEQQHFGNLAANPNEDPDQDGVNNLKEYRAGTNPRDGSSRFEVLEIFPLPEGTYLRWSSQANRRYKIRRAPSLVSAASAYTVIQSAVVATPPFNEFIDTTAPPGAQFFYLLQIDE